MTTHVQCPTCGKTIEWRNEEKWRPFCSKRCRLIDLGAWADESYKIPTQDSPDFETDRSGENSD